MKKSEMLEEFRSSFFAYVRESEDGIDDSRGEYANQIANQSPTDLCLFEPYDFAAIFSGLVGAGQVDGAIIIFLGENRYLGVAENHPISTKLEKLAVREKDQSFLQRVWVCLDWAKRQNEIKPYLFGGKND